MKPARDQWWDTCVKRYSAPVYANKELAKSSKETVKKNRVTYATKSYRSQFIWGDRVRLLGASKLSDDVVQVSARGTTGWMKSSNLKGKPLLELYIIDVGQGDGILLVTPEGHHIMVDGGDMRYRQNGKKNAADFVDWKFYKDYLDSAGRRAGVETKIKLDAMVASHNDIDHFGGLVDLLDYQKEANDIELDCDEVQVNYIFHAGLSWWFNGLNTDGSKKRSLGTVSNGYYTKLLGDRKSALAAIKKLTAPTKSTLSGSWGKFIKAATQTKTTNATDTPIERLSTGSHNWLPGFANTDAGSKVSIRVLGPVSKKKGNKLALKKFSGDSINTNGHSVILRVDYGDRRLLLTGDLNTESQDNLLSHFKSTAETEFACDVAKGCHHGSADVSYKFLDVLSPVATVISSGDSEDYDHPRANIMTSSALTGRKLVSGDGKKLISPLLFITELSRSYKLGKVAELHEFDDPQKTYTKAKPKGDQVHNTVKEKSRFLAFSSSSPKKSSQWPRLDQVNTVTGLVYGLVNVRTDGKNLFFAAKEEKGSDWAISVLTNTEISKATK